jgi:hypothetical protein
MLLLEPSNQEKLGKQVTQREIRNANKIDTGNPGGKRPLGRPSVVGRIILNWVLWKEESNLTAWATIGFCQAVSF